jgi:hypothetical protein
LVVLLAMMKMAVVAMTTMIHWWMQCMHVCHHYGCDNVHLDLLWTMAQWMSEQLVLLRM